MRVFHILADGSSDLFAASHATEISKSLLLDGCGVGVFLEASSGLVEMVLLAVEVGRGAVEVAIGDVPSSEKEYLSTAE